jgi:hypothetical protein
MRVDRGSLRAADRVVLIANSSRDNAQQGLALPAKKACGYGISRKQGHRIFASAAHLATSP